ncbi:YkoF family thiamine/hydroxymethylpyrimidine-binding protein [Pseudidiomarina sp.]|uniref:YkoF family thiamine/hydroxymethylpyrimidine-binding protein n=1 Tax=Pseudidiomarina sp. TaxID=2081707 RepID=UPI00299F15B5|nr:YkoF family thiamine/hydroxymethylpyrimidine-binding protein [Pseudidiomarina sp.]MDX1705436.1 YkoF family thiamine/hydroxymethylpyrimidine-binding protein [Pseudidiomarina sp.]
MKLTVEVSKYPLADEYLEPIKGFIEELNKHKNVHVITNTLSTQLFGDYDDVMAALQGCIRWSFEKYGKVVFVCKFLHGDLRP